MDVSVCLPEGPQCNEAGFRFVLFHLQARRDSSNDFSPSHLLLMLTGQL